MPDSATSASCASALPSAWIRRAQNLLHDQCWSWGRDVDRLDGNLLVQFGFERVPNAEGRTFAYDLRSDDQCQGERVVLAGAGRCYTAAGSPAAALLGRYDVCPRLIRRAAIDLAGWAAIGPSVFQSKGERSARSPLARELLAGALGWIASYEAWVRQVAGPEYRAECLASWSRASVSADRIVEEWESLLSELHAATRAEESDKSTTAQRIAIRGTDV